MPVKIFVSKCNDEYEHEAKTLGEIRRMGNIIGGFDNQFMVVRSAEEYTVWYVPCIWDKTTQYKLAMIVQFQNRVSLKNIRISYTYVSKKWRKRDMASRFYYWIITKLNKNLISDNTLSMGGKYIWWRLSQMPEIEVSLVYNSDKIIRFDKKNKLKRGKRKELVLEDDDNIEETTYHSFMAQKKKGL